MHIRYFHLPCMEIDLLKFGKKQVVNYKDIQYLQKEAIFIEYLHRTVSLCFKEGYGFEKS